MYFLFYNLPNADDALGR